MDKEYLPKMNNRQLVLERNPSKMSTMEEVANYSTVDRRAFRGIGEIGLCDKIHVKGFLSIEKHTILSTKKFSISNGWRMSYLFSEVHYA